MERNKIVLFESGKDIQEGDRFIAHIDSTEGHRRVTLVKIDAATILKDSMDDAERNYKKRFFQIKEIIPGS